MSLKASATKAASQFAVPLSQVVTLRDEIDRRIKALHVPGTLDTPRSAGSMSALKFVRGELQGIISATRAAGKRTNTPADGVLNRAAARLLQRMAEDLDDNAAHIRHAIATDPLSAVYRQHNEHAAQTSEAEASRLWYALTVFMEHTGLGPEDLDTPPERQPRQASSLTSKPE